MKALLICPHKRTAVAGLAEHAPLSLLPVLGKTLIEYWLIHLAGMGVGDVIVYDSNGTEGLIYDALGDGARWGLNLEIVTTDEEMRQLQARDPIDQPEGNNGTHPGKFQIPGWVSPPFDVTLLDHLPGEPETKIFTSYAGWYSAVIDWIPRALTPDRVGYREIKPEVFVGMHTRIAKSANLTGPCWIGDDVIIGESVTIGPLTAIENRSVIKPGARVNRSIIGPETLVGKGTTLFNSLAWGNTLIDWKSGSRFNVSESFLLSPIWDEPTLKEKEYSPEIVPIAPMKPAPAKSRQRLPSQLEQNTLIHNEN